MPLRPLSITGNLANESRHVKPGVAAPGTASKLWRTLAAPWSGRSRNGVQGAREKHREGKRLPRGSPDAHASNKGSCKADFLMCAAAILWVIFRSDLSSLSRLLEVCLPSSFGLVWSGSVLLPLAQVRLEVDPLSASWPSFPSLAPISASSPPSLLSVAGLDSGHGHIDVRRKGLGDEARSAAEIPRQNLHRLSTVQAPPCEMRVSLSDFLMRPIGSDRCQ